MHRAVVLAFVLACRDKAPEPPSVVAPTPAAPSDAKAADPWAAADAAPDTPETRRKRAEAALGRVAAIKPKLAKLRGLAFDREVPTAYQTGAEFKDYVHRGIVKELPPDKSRDLSAAYAHLGLLAKPVDLAQVEEQAVTTQAGAYYDPDVKKFFLVAAPDSEIVLDTISAHELTHALQDQHFDLAKYMPASLDDDQANARKFVVEGDATFAMLLYGIAASTHSDSIPPALLSVIHPQIEKFAALDPAGLKDMTRQQAAAFSTMDEDLKKSIDAMDDIPTIVLIPLLDAYMKGALVAMVAYEHGGGWRGVDALFTDPPTSTEQVLHPATKLFPKREPPRKVTFVKPAGYQQIADNVVGELQWWVYFSLWKPALATEASEGWGGDHYVVLRRNDNRLVALIATVWDTPEDGKQFADAYTATLATRFPGIDPNQAPKGVPRTGGGKLFIRRDGAKVFIVDGADDDKLLTDLVRTAKFE
jgi:hypothetical protein